MSSFYRNIKKLPTHLKLRKPTLSYSSIKIQTYNITTTTMQYNNITTNNNVLSNKLAFISQRNFARKKKTQVSQQVTEDSNDEDLFEEILEPTPTTTAKATAQIVNEDDEDDEDDFDGIFDTDDELNSDENENENFAQANDDEDDDEGLFSSDDDDVSDDDDADDFFSDDDDDLDTVEATSSSTKNFRNNENDMLDGDGIPFTENTTATQIMLRNLDVELTYPDITNFINNIKLENENMRILRIGVPKGKYGSPNSGYCFISCNNNNTAQFLIKQLQNKKLGNRYLKCLWARDQSTETRERGFRNFEDRNYTNTRDNRVDRPTYIRDLPNSKDTVQINLVELPRELLNNDNVLNQMFASMGEIVSKQNSNVSIKLYDRYTRNIGNTPNIMSDNRMDRRNETLNNETQAEWSKMLLNNDEDDIEGSDLDLSDFEDDDNDENDNNENFEMKGNDDEDDDDDNTLFEDVDDDDDSDDDVDFLTDYSEDEEDDENTKKSQ